jgi:hypothetical protein
MSADEIRARMLNDISVNFVDTPFESAARYLQRKTGVNIVIDKTTVPDDALRVPIVFQVKGVPAGEVLSWITRIAGVHHEIQDQAILISSKAAIFRKRVKLGIYDVRDITRVVADFTAPSAVESICGAPTGYGASPGLCMVDGEGMWETSVQGLAEIILQRIRPSDWAAELGTSIEERGGKLVVVHLPEVHKEIEQLLATLRERYGRMIHFRVSVMRVPRDRVAGLTSVAPSGSLDEAGLRAVKTLRATDPERVLASTDFTCFNAQRMSSFGGNSTPYVGDYEISGDTYDAIVLTLIRGLVAEVKPILSDDGKSILLETKLAFTWKPEGGDHAFRPLGNEDGRPYQVAQPGPVDQPRLCAASLATTVRVASGETFTLSTGCDERDMPEGDDLVFVVTPTTVSF